MKNTFKKIIWAIDPFAEDQDLQKRCAETINAISSNLAQVEPVSILHWEGRDAQPEPGNLVEKLAQDATRTVNGLLQAFKVKQAIAPAILTQQDLSLSRAILALLDYSKLAGADLIVVGTQARKGATRFLLGSFAETLILRSTIPVLVVSPRTKPMGKLKRILFPSDLSDKSKAAFPKVLSLAQQTGASVVIFHQVDYGPMTTSNLESMKSDRNWREREGEALVRKAKQTGVDAQLILEIQPRSATSAILELSDEPQSIIAMVSRTNTVESLLLGSITRQVIRQADCPVWVIHPKPEKNKEKPS